MKIIDECMPDIYVKSVYDIDYEKLYSEGIRYALFDVDSTLLPSNAHKPIYKGFKIIRDMFDDECVPLNTIFIGDSLFVDMMFADKCGVKKVLVDYIPDDGFNVKGKVVYLLQTIASKALENKGFYYKKKYYLSKGE